MTQPASVFGSCLATLVNAAGQLDLTPDMQMASGIDVLAQSLIRRQTTPRGSDLASPNDCIDIRAMLLSKGISQSDLGAIAQIIRVELRKDQRVIDAKVAITLNTSTAVITILENIQSAAGPFSLTISLTTGAIGVIVRGQ